MSHPYLEDGNIYTGVEFNRIVAEYNWELFKQFQYKTFEYVCGIPTYFKIGLNECTGYHNSDISDNHIEIYFKNQDGYFKDARCYRVSIPDDALVTVDNTINEFRTNKLIVLNEVDTEWYLKHLDKCGNWIKYAENKTLEMCTIAIKQSSYALKYIKNPTYELCFSAIKRNGYVLQYISDQTAEICLIAVRSNGNSLQYVKNQTKEICLAAVMQTGLALQYVKNQTPEICLAAVKQHGNALQFVKIQTPEICQVAVNTTPGSFIMALYTNKEMCVKYLKDGSLRYIKDQTLDLCIIGFNNGNSLRHVKNRTPEICMEAVKRNGCDLRYVKEQTYELCLTAIKQNAEALQYVSIQTPELCFAAVQKDGKTLQYVKDQTPELCFIAVKNNGYALEYAKYRTSEIIQAASNMIIQDLLIKAEERFSITKKY